MPKVESVIPISLATRISGYLSQRRPSSEGQNQRASFLNAERLLAQKMVCQYKREHRLGYRDCSNTYAGIVAPCGDDFRGLAVGVDRTSSGRNT